MPLALLVYGPQAIAGSEEGAQPHTVSESPGIDASVGGAQGSEEDRRAFSRQRFLEGVAAYEGGRFKDAIDLLLEADAAMHSPAFAYNIGLAYDAMGDAASALRWLRTYLREHPGADDRASVERMVGGLEQRLERRGVQQVTVLSAPEGATVLIDGRAVGVTPWTGELPPGRHVAILQLRGHADAESVFDLEASRARDVAFALTPARREASAATFASTAEGSTPSTGRAGMGPWPWITLGVGAGVLGGALAFELLRARAVGRAEEAAQIDYLDALQAARTHQRTARILAGVGGALVVTGVVLVVVDLGSASAPARAALACTPTGCSLTAGGAL
jgi:tetratricopeptide (TPR) repeat protein